MEDNFLNHFTVQNYNELANVYLHDAELGSVLIDYKHKVVQIKLCTASHKTITSKQLTLQFRKVHDIHMPIEEPWGEGYYLNTVYAVRANDYAFRVCVELNSGDVVVIVAEELELTYS